MSAISEQTLPSPAVTEAWVRLMRAQKHLLAAVETDLKAAGLPPLGWYDVLLELSRAEGGRLRPYEIEQRILLSQYNLSRLLDRMEQKQLLTRRAYEEDGRGRWVELTDKGASLRLQAWSVYGPSLQNHLGTLLSDEEAATLSRLLARLMPDV
nr:MarR family transcriptional regulator [uncultured Gellertiella sp.]